MPGGRKKLGKKSWIQKRVVQTKIKLYAFLCENANVFLQNYNSDKIHNYKTCLKAFFLTFKVQQVQANASFL